MKRVLNVGGNSKDIPLPPEYAGFEHLLLDIDPKGSPDIVCDARNLQSLPAGQFDAVYCSHNLEHYYHHDVPKVLAGFAHVLKDQGWAQIHVPDIQEVMRLAVQHKLDLEDTLYQSGVGPIMVLDVLYGLGREIEQSGNDFYAHKTGFSSKSLLKALDRAGFTKTWCLTTQLEIRALAFKTSPDAETRARFKLPAGD